MRLTPSCDLEGLAQLARQPPSSAPRIDASEMNGRLLLEPRLQPSADRVALDEAIEPTLPAQTTERGRILVVRIGRSAIKHAQDRKFSLFPYPTRPIERERRSSSDVG
jgi:hypothetical protein